MKLDETIVQLNIILAGIQQVLSSWQQKCLQPALCTLYLRVNTLISPPRHTETVVLDDGTQANMSVVDINAAALISLPIDTDESDM